MNFGRTKFETNIIMICIRWYVSYPLSYRNIEEMMRERGIQVDHATINRWVIKFAPKLERKFRKYKKKISGSWRMDETYVKVGGVWHYLYRAVDKEGDTIDFLLTKKRSKHSAYRFLKKAITLQVIYFLKKLISTVVWPMLKVLKNLMNPSGLPLKQDSVSI